MTRAATTCATLLAAWAAIVFSGVAKKEADVLGYFRPYKQRLQQRMVAALTRANTGGFHQETPSRRQLTPDQVGLE